MRKIVNNDKVFTVFNYLLAALFLIAALYPLWYVVICSFSDPLAIMTGEVWIIPRQITLAGFKRMFLQTEIWAGLRGGRKTVKLQNLKTLCFQGDSA